MIQEKSSSILFLKRALLLTLMVFLYPETAQGMKRKTNDATYEVKQALHNQNDSDDEIDINELHALARQQKAIFCLSEPEKKRLKKSPESLIDQKKLDALIERGRKILEVQCQLNNGKKLVFRQKQGLKSGTFDFQDKPYILGDAYTFGSVIHVLPCGHTYTEEEFSYIKEATPEKKTFLSILLSEKILAWGIAKAMLEKYNDLTHDRICGVCRSEFLFSRVQSATIPCLTEEQELWFLAFIFTEVESELQDTVFEQCFPSDYLENNPTYAINLLQKKINIYRRNGLNLSPLIELAMKANCPKLAQEMIEQTDNPILPYDMFGVRKTLLRAALENSQDELIELLLTKCRNPLEYCLLGAESASSAFDGALQSNSPTSFYCLQKLVSISQPDSEVLIEFLEKYLESGDKQKYLYLAENLSDLEHQEKNIIFTRLIPRLLMQPNEKAPIIKVLLQKIGSLDNAALYEDQNMQNSFQIIMSQLYEWLKIPSKEGLKLLLQYRLPLSNSENVEHNSLCQYLNLVEKICSKRILSESELDEIIESVKLLIDFGCERESIYFSSFTLSDSIITAVEQHMQEPVEYLINPAKKIIKKRALAPSQQWTCSIL